MIRLGPTTPWVRDYLRNHVDEAMEAETLRHITPLTGTLLLDAGSDHGPFLAILHTDRTYEYGPSSGYRAKGSTILLALEAVLAIAEPAEADEVTA